MTAQGVTGRTYGPAPRTRAKKKTITLSPYWTQHPYVPTDERLTEGSAIHIFGNVGISKDGHEVARFFRQK
jgi:hypothetical protein